MYVEHQLVKQATLIIEFITIAINNTKITMVCVFTEYGTTSLNHPSCSNNLTKNTLGVKKVAAKN